MKRPLIEIYRTVHRQGFLPILTECDRFDSKRLVEACVVAGFQAIEYTLRRADAATMIPWVRANHPDLCLLIGSTVEDDRIVRHLRRFHPQLLTLDELSALGADGFVSIMGWRDETIRKFAGTHLVIPGSMTLTEAYRQVCAGAHFAKFLGPSLDLVRLARSSSTFGFCPVMVTGGMTLQRIPEAFETGAMLAGTGLEVVLQEMEPAAPVERIAGELRRWLQTAREARQRVWPQLDMGPGDMGPGGIDHRTWLDSLPHYHPFQPAEGIPGEEAETSRHG